jgi:hypothetical protein
MVQFPVDVLEDSFAHVEHDSSLKYILIPLLHEENKKTWKSVSQCLHLFGFSPISPISPTMFEYLKGTISDSKTAMNPCFNKTGSRSVGYRGDHILSGAPKGRDGWKSFFSQKLGAQNVVGRLCMLQTIVVPRLPFLDRRSAIGKPARFRLLYHSKMLKSVQFWVSCEAHPSPRAPCKPFICFKSIDAIRWLNWCASPPSHWGHQFQNARHFFISLSSLAPALAEPGSGGHRSHCILNVLRSNHTIYDARQHETVLTSYLEAFNRIWALLIGQWIFLCSLRCKARTVQPKWVQWV